MFDQTTFHLSFWSLVRNFNFTIENINHSVPLSLYLNRYLAWKTLSDSLYRGLESKDSVLTAQGMAVHLWGFSSSAELLAFCFVELICDIMKNPSVWPSYQALRGHHCTLFSVLVHESKWGHFNHVFCYYYSRTSVLESFLSKNN